MRKWLILIIVIILGGALIGSWLEYRHTKVVGNILNSIPFIDSITVRDGKTKEEIINFSSLDPSFSDMVEIYYLPYKDLKWSERKLLKEEPFIEVEYIKNNEIRYKVSIYQVKEEHMSMLSIDNPTAFRSYSYSYSPEETNTNYLFAIKDNYQLLGVNEGLKELLKIITQTSHQNN